MKRVENGYYLIALYESMGVETEQWISADPEETTSFLVAGGHEELLDALADMDMNNEIYIASDGTLFHDEMDLRMSEFADNEYYKVLFIQGLP